MVGQHPERDRVAVPRGDADAVGHEALQRVVELDEPASAMSASAIEVKTLVIEPISKIVRLSGGPSSSSAGRPNP